MPITILLVDDDAFNREGVRLFLSREGFEILEAGDEAAAWQVITARQPAAAVVDISIPPEAATPPAAQHAFGLRLAENIKREYPKIGVVLFSAFDDRGGDLLKLIQAGHRGLAYQLKGRAPSKLLAALKDVLAGRVVIDPEVQFNRRTMAATLLTRIGTDELRWVERALENLDTLTPREQDVVQRLAASHNTEGIAQALSVTPKTAENYITSIYDKLGLNEMGREAPHLRKIVVLAKACMVSELQG